MVEHRTENPCVLGSTPRSTTPPFIRAKSIYRFVLFSCLFVCCYIYVSSYVDKQKYYYYFIFFVQRAMDSFFDISFVQHYSIIERHELVFLIFRLGILFLESLLYNEKKIRVCQNRHTLYL